MKVHMSVCVDFDICEACEDCTVRPDGLYCKKTKRLIWVKTAEDEHIACFTDVDILVCSEVQRLAKDLVAELDFKRNREEWK